ncbi:MAG: hypothetical protein H7Z14_07330 [Anaerolineae bacterium]|nr:hypothetical protein [Phycisphaerae bacterium]
MRKLGCKRPRLLRAILMATLGCTISRAEGAVPVYGGPPDPNWYIGFGLGVTDAGDGQAITRLNNGGPFHWDASGASPVPLRPLLGSAPLASSRAWTTNPAGIAVGYTADESGTVPVLWDTTGTPLKLSGLSAVAGPSTYFGSANAINAAGVIVGEARKTNGSQDLGMRAVRWSAGDHTITELGTLGTSASGLTNVHADVVNPAGTTVGRGTRYNFIGQLTGTPPIRWEAGSTVAIELESFGNNQGGTSQSDVKSINAFGTAVGWSHKYTNGRHTSTGAARWDGNSTTITELYGIGPDVAAGTISNLALGISDRGTVVGYEDRYSMFGSWTGTHAIRWDAGATAPTPLGELGVGANGKTNSRAYSINANDIAVGYAATFSGGNYAGDHAVAWGSDGIAIDLNLLIDPASGWILRQADDISDNDWVTGTGLYDPDGPGGTQPYYRGFLIQIPEPIFAGALVLLPLYLRRRRKFNQMKEGRSGR